MLYSEAYEMVRERLATPSSWLKGSWAHNDVGHPVGWTDDHAIKFCLSGACRNVDPTKQLTAHTREHLFKFAGTYIIPTWNDDVATFETLHAFLDFCVTEEERVEEQVRAVERKRIARNARERDRRKELKRQRDNAGR